MKNLLFLLFVLIAGNGFSQSLDCKKFKDGKFRLAIPEVANYIITREGNTQTELEEGSGLEILFDVEWITDCTYTLVVKKVLNNPDNLPIPLDMILTVEIIKVTENSYTQSSSSNNSDMVLESEMIRIQ